ncbi:MAG TPA: YARHG domain-containing protein, partial [Mucilaginibacter sp.]|nr:YARHG domain-containing protein [Mucilaginibacter sp.]
RLFAQDIRVNYMPEEGPDSLAGCDINSIKVINDSLYEVKTGAALWFDLYDSTKTITGGTYYHYLAVRNNKLVELPNSRIFGFTKYMKLDDSYLSGCYTIAIGLGYENKEQTKKIEHITPELLRYMKNEIYADYGYKFKDKRWMDVFENMPNYAFDFKTQAPKAPNVSVDDSLTAIDKYNINWIEQKLKGAPSTTLAAK